jgi:PadR family transcriptional regulator, regulatory protein AphA
MADEIELTPTSHIVLGLLSKFGEATPYDLKQMVSVSVGQFWTMPHSQLYAEPARLARAGYVTEQQEPRGRRRKLYNITATGQAALDRWLSVLAPEPYVLRDPALLKLFFDADVNGLARVQLEAHRAKLAEHESLQALDPGTGPRGAWLALELGTRHERETVRFWSEHAQAKDERGPGN